MLITLSDDKGITQISLKKYAERKSKFEPQSPNTSRSCFETFHLATFFDLLEPALRLLQIIIEEIFGKTSEQLLSC